MNLKRGLIGLFILTFLVSGIGLGLLVLDDQNDLSSRAATSISHSARAALPGIKPLENNLVWSGDILSLPVQVNFDKSTWLPPTDQDPVFLNTQSTVTVRITKNTVDLPNLKKILGDNFIFSQDLGIRKDYLAGWQTQTYQFIFLNDEIFVDVWTNGSGISVIAVMPEEISRGEVLGLVRGILPANQVKGSTTDDSARLAAVIRPSVVMILAQNCAQISFTEISGSSLLGKAYPFCLAQVGSGFFVNPSGYIGTNGHVVTSTPDTSLVYAVMSGSLDNFLVDFFQAYIMSQSGLAVDRVSVETKIKDAHQSKETLSQFAALTRDLLKKNFIKVEKATNKYFVQLGNTPLQYSKAGVNVGQDIVSATFIDSDYKDYNDLTGFSSSDVALLKINGENYPSLPLGKISDVSVGSDVLVVGFPGVAMGSQSLLLDTSANSEPTFTRGVISAFKQAKGDKKNLIQTDASINHGNSGGPAISSKGEVIGIATYGLTAEDGSGNYNFLRDVADLKVLMDKNHITAETGQTYNTWKSGLDNYWISYLRPAKTDFEKVVRLYSSHPSVGKYLADATAKVGTADDKTPRFTRAQRRLLMNIAGGLMAFSVLAIIILAISNFVDSKRHRAGVMLPSPPQMPSQPIQTF